MPRAGLADPGGKPDADRAIESTRTVLLVRATLE
jgi:hypothetical protein